MSLSEALTPFLYSFYIIGESPFPSVRLASKTKFVKFLFKLPVLILICVSIYVTIHFLRNDYFVACDRRGLDIIHILLIMSSLITNLSISYQCLFHGTCWTQIQESLCRIETEFQNLLPNTNLKLSKFRKQFLLKFFVILLSYFTLSLAMIMFRIENVEYYHKTYMIVLTIINDSFALQVVFYVDLIKLFLKTITDTFYGGGVDAKCVNEAFIDTKFILSTKKLHSSIYKVVEKINEYFGFFLLSYIIHQFLAISYYIFWIFLNKFTAGFWSSVGS